MRRLLQLPAHALALTVAALLLPAAAQAAPSNYQCTGYKPLRIEFTPTKAQVHFEGQDHELLRVRDGREARYTGRQGVSLMVRKGQMLLSQGGHSYQCKLLSNALTPENLGVRAPAPPGTRPAAPAASR